MCQILSLRSFEGVEFVSSPDELIQALGRKNPREQRNIKPKDFFCLDSKLPHWKKLLELNTQNTRGVNNA